MYDRLKESSSICGVSTGLALLQPLLTLHHSNSIYEPGCPLKEHADGQSLTAMVYSYYLLIITKLVRNGRLQIQSASEYWLIMLMVKGGQWLVLNPIANAATL